MMNTITVFVLALFCTSQTRCSRIWVCRPEIAKKDELCGVISSEENVARRVSCSCRKCDCEKSTVLRVSTVADVYSCFHGIGRSHGSPKCIPVYKDEWDENRDAIAELSCPPCAPVPVDCHAYCRGDTATGKEVATTDAYRRRATLLDRIRAFAHFPVEWLGSVIHAPLDWITSARFLVRSLISDVHTLFSGVVMMLLGVLAVWTVRAYPTVLTLMLAFVPYTLLDVTSHVHPLVYAGFVGMVLYVQNDAFRSCVTTAFDTIGHALTHTVPLLSPRRTPDTTVVAEAAAAAVPSPWVPGSVDVILRKVVLLWHADFTTTAPKARPEWEAKDTHALPSKKGCNKAELLEACRLLGVPADASEAVKPLEAKVKRGFEAAMRHHGVTSATLFA